MHQVNFIRFSKFDSHIICFLLSWIIFFILLSLSPFCCFNCRCSTSLPFSSSFVSFFFLLLSLLVYLSFDISFFIFFYLLFCCPFMFSAPFYSHTQYMPFWFLQYFFHFFLVSTFFLYLLVSTLLVFIYFHLCFSYSPSLHREKKILE